MVGVHIGKPGDPQVTGLICARICARDVARRAETRETPRLDLDPRRASAEVSATAGDWARRQRRPSYCS